MPPSRGAVDRRAMDQAAPLLVCQVTRWLRRHGKTVRPKLRSDQLRTLKQCFEMMDGDGSGAIDADELYEAFQLLGLSHTRRQVEAVLRAVDKDGTGELELAEFLELMASQGLGSTTAASGGVESHHATKARLPFELVALSYRRARLLQALEAGDAGALHTLHHIAHDK